MKPRLLDLFCGAGGASEGYHRAGFDVVGVDIQPQPNYPFSFQQEDAIDFLEEALDKFYPWLAFQVIHASPPCQHYSNLAKRNGNSADHPDMIAEVRAMLEMTEIPYVIENVVGAPLLNPVTLCGSMFGLDVKRHRLFETNWELPQPGCDHRWESRFPMTGTRRKGKLAKVVHVHGQGNHHFSGPGCFQKETQLRRDAMGIQWMDRAELNEAIPPAYTEYIGGHLMRHCATTP